MALGFLESPSSHTWVDWKPIGFRFCQKHILVLDIYSALIPSFLRKDPRTDLRLSEGKTI